MRSSRWGVVAASLLLAGLTPVIAAPPAMAAPQTYAYTGGPQIYVVPPGVTSIQVSLEGGAGATIAGGGAGGLGGRITGAIAVTPGEVLQVMVGGSGASGGYNGGSGGGGGASDIRRPTFSTSSSCAYNLTCTYSDRIIVAGGGGGAGHVYNASGGGNGGAGGAVPAAGTSMDDSATPGGPGTLAGGGSGGNGGGSGGGSGIGASGGSGLGNGDGGALGWKPGANGGGGGGGYSGGGGGGAYTNLSAAGGGGGSSWGGGAGVSVDDSTTGSRVGNGVITIDPPSAITNAAFGLLGTGVDDTFTVPPGVTSLAVRLYGAKGAAAGDVVFGQLPVTPGQVLQVTIGGAAPPVKEAVGGGSTTGGQGGYNGGGAAQSTGLGDIGTTGGGGASDIRISPYGLDQRVVVAGGGGGCGAPFWCPSNGWSPGDGGDDTNGVGGTGFWSAGGTKFSGGSLTSGGTWLDAAGNPIATPGVSQGAWGAGGSGRSGAGGGYYGGAGGDASGGGSSYASVTGPDLTRSGMGNVLGVAGAPFQHLQGGNVGDGMAVITAMPIGVTSGASSIRTTRAYISGTVNPQFLASTPTVQYSSVDETTVTNGLALGSQSITSNGATVLAGNSTQSVAGFITGLSANTTYWYRVCAQSVAGNGCGATMSFTTLPNGFPDFSASTPTSPTTVLAPYAYTFTATGNTPLTMSVHSGTLPPGLSFTPGTGVLAGTPTSLGTYTFVMRVSNSLGAADDTCVISVAGIPPVLLDDTPPPSATVGIAYAPYTFTASGVEAPTFSVSAGSLPAGLTLDPNTGMLSGTPTTVGTTSFTVRASNSAGTSDSPSLTIAVLAAPNPTPSQGIPPSAPTNVTASAGNAQATVTWGAPVTPGSFPVTSYQVTAAPGGASCLTSSTSCTITGLTNGTTYTFTAVALNGAGWGAAATSGPVTPSVNPGPTPAPGPQPIPAPLPPGSSSLVVNGTPQTLTVTPNTSDNGLRVVADDFDMTLDGLGPDGQPLNLSPTGVLLLDQEREAQSSGRGFLGRSDVDFYIDPPVSAPRGARSAGVFVGTLVTAPDGTFSGRITLPDSISAGDHVLQAVGLTSQGQPRAVSIGVRVNAWIELAQGVRVASGRHDRIRTSGDSAGIPAGTRLTPWIRYAGQSSFTQGVATITVNADGTFRWTRQIRKDKAVTAYVSYTSTESNRVTWARVK